jgi:hypothetical protein
MGLVCRQATPVPYHSLFCTGFYIAIERNVDVKKLIGMKGKQL